MRFYGMTAWVLVAVGVAFLALLWVGQRRLIYFPMARLPAPQALGLADTESVAFQTSDGLTLGAWFVAASDPPPRPVVLVFHGNAGTRAHRARLALALRQFGLHVLLTDYRGYAGNPGSPSEDGLALDARAARAYLASRPDVDRSRIIYFGESIGSAVAIRLAVEQPPAALILRSPFTSLVEVGRHHYGFLPVALFLRDRFASVELAPHIKTPVLVIAGDRDSIVPIDHTRRLYDVLVAPKRFVVLSGADHNDEALLAGEEMLQAIGRFLDTL